MSFRQNAGFGIAIATPPNSGEPGNCGHHPIPELENDAQGPEEDGEDIEEPEDLREKWGLKKSPCTSTELCGTQRLRMGDGHCFRMAEVTPSCLRHLASDVITEDSPLAEQIEVMAAPIPRDCILEIQGRTNKRLASILPIKLACCQIRLRFRHWLGTEQVLPFPWGAESLRKNNNAADVLNLMQGLGKTRWYKIKALWCIVEWIYRYVDRRY